MTIIKSYKELSKLNRRKLFKRRGKDLILKPMDKRRAVSIARQLADGFGGVDLRQEPSAADYRRAQKVIKTYYENVKDKSAIVIRPSKANRKLYSQAADIPNNFKVYPVHVSNKANKLKVVKKGGKKKIKEVGEFVSYENFYFEDPQELALNPEKETQKLVKDIEKIKGVKQVNIIVGSYLTNANYDIDFLEDEIKRYSMIYSNFQEFTRGLQVATFNNQKKRKTKNAKTTKRNIKRNKKKK